MDDFRVGLFMGSIRRTGAVGKSFFTEGGDQLEESRDFVAVKDPLDGETFRQLSLEGTRNKTNLKQAVAERKAIESFRKDSRMWVGGPYTINFEHIMQMANQTKVGYCCLYHVTPLLFPTCMDYQLANCPPQQKEEVLSQYRTKGEDAVYVIPENDLIRFGIVPDHGTNKKRNPEAWFTHNLQAAYHHLKSKKKCYPSVNSKREGNYCTIVVVRGSNESFFNITPHAGPYGKSKSWIVGDALVFHLPLPDGNVFLVPFWQKDEDSPVCAIPPTITHIDLPEKKDGKTFAIWQSVFQPHPRGSFRVPTDLNEGLEYLKESLKELQNEIGRHNKKHPEDPIKYYISKTSSIFEDIEELQLTREKNARAQTTRGEKRSAWDAHLDPQSGRKYYVNRETKMVQDKPPADF